MVALVEQDRLRVGDQVIGNPEPNQPLQGLLKADLRAAVNAIDDWIDANAASFNQAIPQPARAALTPRQKARLLTHVVERRWKVT